MVGGSEYEKNVDRLMIRIDGKIHWYMVPVVSAGHDWTSSKYERTMSRMCVG